MDSHRTSNSLYFFLNTRQLTLQHAELTTEYMTRGHVQGQWQFCKATKLNLIKKQKPTNLPTKYNNQSKRLKQQKFNFDRGVELLF